MWAGAVPQHPPRMTAPPGPDAAHLPGKVIGPAPVDHTAAGHQGVASVGHGGYRQPAARHPLQHRGHGAGGQQAVQAHGVHLTAGRHPGRHLPAGQALPGVAVGQRRKGYQHKGVRPPALDIGRSFSQAGVAAEGLKQEIFRTQLQKHFRYRLVALGSGVGFGVGGGPHVREQGALSPCLCQSLGSQLPAGPGQLLPAGNMGCRHPGQAEGIGLEGLSPCRQVFPVHRQDARRVLQVGLFALQPRPGLVIGAHPPRQTTGRGLSGSHAHFS